MRNFFIFFVSLALCAQYGEAYAAETPFKVTVIMEGFKDGNGVALVTLYNSAKGFPGDRRYAIKKAKTTISSRMAQLVFEGLPAGEYAVSAFHDENGDGELGKNFIGIPTEGYGTSNNQKPGLSHPSYEKARFFVVDADVTLKVIMRY